MKIMITSASTLALGFAAILQEKTNILVEIPPYSPFCFNTPLYLEPSRALMLACLEKFEAERLQKQRYQEYGWYRKFEKRKF